jgi:hypothetical protein
MLELIREVAGEVGSEMKFGWLIFFEVDGFVVAMEMQLFVFVGGDFDGDIVALDGGKYGGARN